MNTRRFDSLQGLRGLAALVVVLSHFLELFYRTGYDLGTPLEFIRPVSHLFGILSYKSVWIFFVLSGFVLTHQLCSRTYTYRQYIFARLMRLYIPVWAAILLNLAVIYYLISKSKEIKFWIGSHPDYLSLKSVILELLLVPNGYFLGPLWSLKWEVLFSLVAFIVWKSRLLMRFPKVIGIVSIAAATIGEALGSPSLRHLPMFLVGTIIYNSSIRTASTSSIKPRLEIFAILIAALLPVASYILFSDRFGLAQFRYVADVASSLISIWIIFIALMKGSLLRKVFEIKPLQALGNISFSLYLFHLPVLSLAFYLSDFDFFWTLFAFVLCFPVARVGFSLIESPAQRISRKIRTGNQHRQS